MLYSHYYLSTAILDNLLKDICTCSYQEEFKKSLIDYLKKSTLVKSVFNLNYKSKTNSKTIEPTSYFYNLRLLYISDNKYKYEIIRWFEHSLIKFVSPSLIISSNGNIHQNKDVRTRLTKYIYIKDSTEFKTEPTGEKIKLYFNSLPRKVQQNSIGIFKLNYNDKRWTIEEGVRVMYSISDKFSTNYTWSIIDTEHEHYALIMHRCRCIEREFLSS